MQIPLQPLVLLYLAFAAKQLAADYFLQTSWMAMGKKAPRGWLAPVVAHAGVHATATLLIALVSVPSLWWLGPLDFVLHASIDRGKAVLSRHLTLTDVRFWWAFGLDQAAHQLTHFGFVILLVTRL
ncbi:MULTISPECIES: DUF3307 domain-containing protein [unclassified Aureimonas]|uniref:DUF3307 domain-containing protein n=1 Tax=unclassified Aureimonas TaxID=2615206 RepID=UPI0006FD07A2|nr:MULTISPECIES: DUF3307 domain-containing protein [unclassified Aureimonas]KQT52570.1 hypothetical protein ASG62_15305 [Aureimonas sp. Leaf427]KQT77529.1 hypothetical protein ASG54_11105 [Aureimonas sp. Leaf460]